MTVWNSDLSGTRKKCFAFLRKIRIKRMYWSRNSEDLAGSKLEINTKFVHFLTQIKTYNEQEKQNMKILLITRTLILSLVLMA